MGYFANGCEGDYLDSQCFECRINDAYCPVRQVQDLYNYKQCKDGQQLLRDCLDKLITGRVCNMKKEIDESKQYNKTMDADKKQ